MKVLVTAEHFLPKIGGVEKSINSIADEFSRRGDDVLLLTRRFDTSLPSLEKREFTIQRYDCKLKSSNVFYAKTLYNYLVKFFKTFDLNQFDLIIVRDSVTASAILKYRKKNVIYIPAAFIIEQFDGFDMKLGIVQNIRLLFRYFRFKGFLPFEKGALRKSLHVATYSENMKKQVQKYSTSEVIINHPGLTKKVNNNKVDVLLKGTVKFLFVGRLVSFKNIDMIIKAFEKLNKEDATLYIVGNGDQNDILKQLAAKMKNKENIIFTGQVNNVQDYYQNCDFSITASDYETFGFNILESLAYGTPVIGFGSKKTGLMVALEEMVTDEFNGYVCNEFTIDSLSEKMEVAYNFVKSSKDDYLQMRENAKKIIDEYNWVKFVDTLIKIGCD